MPVAVRAYTPPAAPPKPRRETPGPDPDAPVLVFDTEDRTDPSQRLTFGCWRVLVAGETIDEGLFHAEDLPAEDLDELRDYCRTHRADTTDSEPLRLLSLRRFLRDVLWKVGGKARGPIVGLNLPFDWGRAACDWGEARGDFYGGGFSLVLWDYAATDGWREDKHRPRLSVKSLDSKRSLMGFGKRLAPDREDLIPEGSTDGEPDPAYAFPGHLLDLRTHAFALTNEATSLAKLCAAFGVAHGKLEAEEHGRITPAYIAYARRDVLATAELLAKLLEEHARHPIALSPTKAYSPASIGKAYLRAMGIRPVLARQPDFPPEVLGWAMAAYYGGCAECRIRKTSMPVVYCDFLSMYPTVNTLMGLWGFLTAKRIDIEDATERARELLAGVTVGECFDPAFWRALPVLVLIEPVGDVVPVRGRYGEGDAWQIGVNVLAAGEPRWHTLADCVASTLLAGKPPRVLRAVGLAPSEDRLPELKPVKLRGAVPVDPATDDFFRAVIELRKAPPADLEKAEQKRLGAFLKVLANSTSYGIFAEMNRKDERGKPVAVTVHGAEAAPFRAKVTGPEEPGEYCFPPLAAFIAGAARLMLALLERCVTDLGGTYAMCDTDSMAIVASEQGGRVPCPGGHETVRRTPSVRALSWAEVDGIVARFARLNPYDPSKIPGSVLKVEDVNFGPDGRRRELRCYSISAKRYALYELGDNGGPELVAGKEHGLGHLLDPTDPDDEAGTWIRQLWQAILQDAHGLGPQWPAWLDRPALSRLTVSSSELLEPFAGMDAGKPYAERVKPFNFLLAAHVARFGHPDGVDPARFQLIAPFERDARRWNRLPWVDRYSGDGYRITTGEATGGPGFARVQTYRDVLEDFLHHPEAKSAGPDGRPCGRQTVGLLGRRAVRSLPELTTHVGKESNKLEEVEAGLEHDPDEVWTEYADPARDPWQTLVLPVLQAMPLAEFKGLGLHRRSLFAIRAGERLPHPRNRRALTEQAAAYARGRLRETGLLPPPDDLAACAAYIELDLPRH